MSTEFTNELELRILVLCPLEIMGADVLISNIPFQIRFNLKSRFKLWHTFMILSFERENYMFEAGLNYKERCCLKTKSFFSYWIHLWIIQRYFCSSVKMAHLSEAAPVYTVLPVIS